MLGDLATIIGSGIVSAVLVYLFAVLGQNKGNGDDVSLGDNHVLLRILILALIMGSFMVLGKATLDSANEYCDIVVANETVDATLTTYTYEQQCFANTQDTGVIFYKIVTWFVYFMSAYLFFYILYKLWIAIKEGLFSRRRGR